MQLKNYKEQMYNKVISTTIVSLFLLQAQAQTEVKVNDLKIKSATVYTSGALVNNTFTAAVEAGQSTVLVSGLPSSLNSESVQISAKGDIIIMGVNTDAVSTSTKNKAISLLEDSLEAKRAIENSLQNKKFALEQEESVLNANKYIGGANGGVNVADLQDAIELYRTRMETLRNEKYTLDKKLIKLSEGIARLQYELDLANSKQNQNQSLVSITVSAKSKTTASFTLSYITPNASWTPIYDIRSNGAGAPVKLSYTANIQQNSGTDWNNVKLSVSTGNPNDNGNVPEITAQYVDFYNPNIYYAKPMMKREESLSDEESKQQLATRNVSSVAEAATTANYTVATEYQLARVFDIDLPYSIPANGKKVAVEIQTNELAANYRHASVPKYDPSAYLVAYLTDWEKLNLVPATANIYLEGSYVGQSYINPSVSTDSLQISLGKDKGVIVTRENVKDYKSEKLIGTNKRLTIAYKITVRNTKKTAIELDLKDQLPVSNNKDIEIKAEDLDGGDINNETGIINWKINLKPQATKTIVLKFEVKYPKDKQLNTNF